MDAEAIINPNPRPEIPVSGRGDPKSLGRHLYERVKDAPRGVAIDLVAIGPLAVNHGVQAVIYTNTKLIARGVYLTVVPTKKVVERRPSKDESAPDYGDSNATVLVCCLKECE